LGRAGKEEKERGCWAGLVWKEIERKFYFNTNFI
jgi:hypothetical protein